MKVNKEDILNSGRRDKIKIMAAIVALTLEPAKTWQISRQAHLNQQQIKQYVTFMTKKNLIEKQPENQTKQHKYYATEKGHKFLKKYCDNLRLLYGEEYIRKSTTNLAITGLQYNKNQTKSNQLFRNNPNYLK